MSGLRSKINDRFEFPSELDMAPYHIDNLKDTSSPSVPDIFELVGILVHSGTAESGHYYSYIRERPVNPNYGKTWVEYNDADLTPFDPSNIPDQCYGGMIESPPFTAYYKQWNAYCLFYQRRESINADIQAYHPSAAGIPVKAEVPTELYNRIVTNNELFARRYCLLDPCHASFARSLLAQLRYINNDTCSNSHDTEKEAIWLALEHLNHVFSRVKDCFGFQDMMDLVKGIIGTCSCCCKIALEWVTLYERNIRTMLLRCPSSRVRNAFADVIFTALKYLRTADSQAYGLKLDDGLGATPEAISSEFSGALPNIVQSLRDLTYYMPSHSRAWDDYYGLLASIASLGIPETRLILCHGFLATCLEFLVVEHSEAKEPLRRRHSFYGTYLRLTERGRKFSLKQLVDLLRILLESVNLIEEPATFDEGDDRPIVEGKAMLSVVEEEMIRFGSEVQRPRTLVFLERLLTANYNSPAGASIVRTLVLAEPENRLLVPIQKTILNGVNVEPATMAVPYLEAALAYCETCPSQSSIRDTLKQIALEVDTIGSHGGQEHLEFFSRARRLSNIRISRGPPFFTRLILLNVPHWAPALLMYCDEHVRNNTIDLLQSLVFDRDTQNMDNEDEAETIERIGRELCMTCVKRIQSTVLQERKPVESRSIDHVERVVAHCVHKYCQDTPFRPQAVIAEGTS